MNNGQKSLSINETFIIEAENDGTMSACTGFFTNTIVSCTGNTQIILGANIIQTDSAFSATTFYGDGSNLTGISTQDTFVTGGTYSAGTAVFTNNTGGTFSVTGFSTSTGVSFTGGTVSGATIFTNGLSANTFSATIYQNLPLDIRVTGATKSGTVATFTNNTGGTFNLTGLTDVFVSGGTHSLATGTTTFVNSTGGTFDVSGYFKPSDDIYVTSGVVDHGPSYSENNLLTLTRSDTSSVIIGDLVNISDTTKADIDALIDARRIIRGKTYKISNCDSTLFLNGIVNGDPTFTTIYLMGLESNKLSETGIGIFYTPKYSDFQIFVDGNAYNQNDMVIWGGFVWQCSVSGSYNSVDLFNLNTNGFSIIYPINDSGNLNESLYNIQYDNIIYDYENDRIIYRNEQDTNIVQTSNENIRYWENTFGYNPIKVFKWGNVYDVNADLGIGNQRIINSYNENINFNGIYQINFYFDNLSYQRRLTTNGSNVFQSNFVLTNQSSINKVTLHENTYQQYIYLSNESNFDTIEIYSGAYQSHIILDNFSYFLSITLNDNSYQKDIRLENGSYFESITLGESCFQKQLIFNNGSYQQSVELINSGGIARQEFFNFTNQSSQVSVSINSVKQEYFNFNSGYQNNIFTDTNQININIENGSQTNVNKNQLNITIKGYSLDWGSYPSISPQTNLFFINDLPTETTSRLIGKKDNRLVEVSDFYYDGSKWIIEGGFSVNTISANTISANTISTNTISANTYNGYIPLPTQAASSTGVVLSFITDTVYGTLATPETGTTISANTVNGQLGVTNIVIHSGGTAPTFSSQYKKLSGSGNYTTGQINYIFATYITSTEIIYAINQRT